MIIGWNLHAARIMVLGAIVSISVADAAQAVITKTMRLDAVDLPCRRNAGSCSYPSAEGGGFAPYFVQASDCLDFNDGLPFGSIVYRVDVKASIINAASPGTMTFSVNPESIS